MDKAALLAHVREQIETARTFYVNDLTALSEEALSTSFAGNARVPYDFTYEVVIVNQRVTARLTTGVVPAWPFGDGWATAPDDFKSKEVAIAAVNASVDEILAAVGDDVTRMITTSEGEKPAFDLALFAGMHMMYHDAQLNYVQSLHGDAAMHWM